MSKEPNCSGCRICLEPYNETAFCIAYNKHGNCPCSQCIVKAMCDDFCDLADAWWNKTQGVT